MSMFCYQCEQTARSTGCTASGVCGKDPETAALQDLLVYLAKGVSQYASKLRGSGVKTPKADRFVIKALFTTVTNVNFDAETVAEVIRTGVAIRKELRESCQSMGCANELTGPAVFEIADKPEVMEIVK